MPRPKGQCIVSGASSADALARIYAQAVTGQKCPVLPIAFLAQQVGLSDVSLFTALDCRFVMGQVVLSSWGLVCTRSMSELAQVVMQSFNI